MADDRNGPPEPSFRGVSEVVVVKAAEVESRRVLRRLLNVRITEKRGNILRVENKQAHRGV